MFESLTQEEVDEFNELDRIGRENLDADMRKRYIEIIVKYRMSTIYSNLVEILPHSESAKVALRK